MYNKNIWLIFYTYFYAVYFSQVYKQKTEVAKKEYLKALAAYRASLVSKVINQLIIVRQIPVVACIHFNLFY